MYSPQQILSDNTKTDYSLNLPIQGHCNPTPICRKTCYAKTGRLIMSNCIRKQTWLSRQLKERESGFMTRLIKEAGILQAVRLMGSGDILAAHIKALYQLAKECPRTMFWGMTRKPKMASRINNTHNNLKLLVTVDNSSPASTWDYGGAMCFGPRMPEDVALPNDNRIITVFPYHYHGKVAKGVQTHPKDCQAVWHKISGCGECGRCWSWDII